MGSFATYPGSEGLDPGGPELLAMWLVVDQATGAPSGGPSPFPRFTPPAVSCTWTALK
jgi:hypothetical protein